MKYKAFLQLTHDELVKMYTDDSDNFMFETTEAIKDSLNEIPNSATKLKCEKLQWVIDGELRKIKDPIARMNKMMELFYEGVKELDGALKPFRTEIEFKP